MAGVAAIPMHRNGGARVVATLLVLVVAIGLSLTVALANTAYFDAVNALVGARETVARGLVFSSWLVLIGGPFVLVRPAAFGFALGETIARWRFVAAVASACAGVTALVLAAVGSTPYSAASPFIETVVVPFTEELVFRGVLLAGLLFVLARLHPPRPAVTIAVLINGLAFGVAHLANATNLDPGFVVAQATFASGLGIVCASVAVKARSVFPAMFVHAVVNAVVVAM